MDITTNMRPSVCFEVQKIIGISCSGNIRNYQVQWAPTWITDMQLVGCDHLIDEFFSQQPAKIEYGAEPTIVDNETLDENLVNENINEQYKMVNDENFTKEEQLEDRNENDGNIEQENTVHILSNPYEDDSDFVPCSMVLNDNTVITRSDAIDQNQLSSHMSTVLDFPVTNSTSETDFKTNNKNGIFDISAIKSEDSTEQAFSKSSSSFSLDRLESEHSSKQTFTSEPTSSFLLDRLKSKDSTEQAFNNGESTSSSLLDRLNDAKVSHKTRCTKCKKAFKNKELLIHHMKIAHKMKMQPKQLKRFMCNVCRRTFSKEASLAVHLCLACSTCGKKFTYRTDLIRHERIHSGEKPFRCDQCGKNFSRREKLRNHSCVS